jgi:signal recognition particle receptor subunit alpha
MLDHISIFNQGGIVLWDLNWEKLKGNPINALIQTIFLEDRSGTEQFVQGGHALKWERANDLGLYFVAVYQNIMQKSPYLDTLLLKVKESFVELYGEKLKNVSFPVPGQFNFEKQFQNILAEASQKSQIEKKEVKAPKKFEDTAKGKELAKSNPTKVKKPDPPKPTTPEKVPSTSTPNAVKRPVGAKKLMPNKPCLAQSNPSGFKEGQKRPKVATKWNAKTDADPAALNFCVENSEDENFILEKQKKLDEDNEKYDIGGTTHLEFSESEDSSFEEDQPSQSAVGGIMSFFSSITNKELTETDLKPVLDQFQSSLIEKNVAQEIAEKICESVCNSLVGKKLGTFTRVKTTVIEAMGESITRLLTPKRTIDILRDARIAKQQKRPYIITFVGVNGVGKTTSLAKIVSWLKQNDMKVIIAAYDTYRSGAVEQLLVHANNLEVEIFQRGYGKVGNVDAAGIAFQAIEEAKKKGIDIVVIDTSGRMQDNAPLMKDLAKLVDMNEPDLVLFVGEALVGNDSVDQLTKFNACLEENSKSRKLHGIDGIVLTKFDTVDEKVGAAISMVYTTGQPIVFVGVGQKYSDLRVLDVKKMVSILLK